MFDSLDIGLLLFEVAFGEYRPPWYLMKVLASDPDGHIVVWQSNTKPRLRSILERH